MNKSVINSAAPDPNSVIRSVGLEYRFIKCIASELPQRQLLGHWAARRIMAFARGLIPSKKVSIQRHEILGAPQHPAKPFEVRWIAKTMLAAQPQDTPDTHKIGRAHV